MDIGIEINKKMADLLGFLADHKVKSELNARFEFTEKQTTVIKVANYNWQLKVKK